MNESGKLIYPPTDATACLFQFFILIRIEPANILVSQEWTSTECLKCRLSWHPVSVLNMHDKQSVRAQRWLKKHVVNSKHTQIYK